MDRTNLAGTFDFQIDWTPELPVPSVGAPAPDPNAVSIFTALREQLGLKLDSGKRLVDVLIVDHVEHPTEN